MRTAQKYMWLIAIITLVAACQSPKQVLSKSDSRMEIMASIASDHDMSKAMMAAISRGEHGKMLMHERMKAMMENKSMMTKMMKDDPDMKKRMMLGVMEAAKADTSMMSQMCKAMVNKPEMMEMMMSNPQKMKGTMNHMINMAAKDTVMFNDMVQMMKDKPEMWSKVIKMNSSTTKK